MWIYKSRKEGNQGDNCETVRKYKTNSEFHEEAFSLFWMGDNDLIIFMDEPHVLGRSLFNTTSPLGFCLTFLLSAEQVVCYYENPIFLLYPLHFTLINRLLNFMFPSLLCFSSERLTLPMSLPIIVSLSKRSMIAHFVHRRISSTENRACYKLNLH